MIHSCWPPTKENPSVGFDLGSRREHRATFAASRKVRPYKNRCPNPAGPPLDSDPVCGDFPAVFLRFKTHGDRVTRFGRMTALLAAGLVATLVLGTVSPGLHEQLCHHDSDSGVEHCVIVAFAAGEAYAAPVPLPVAPRLIRVEAVSPARVAEARLLAPFRLLPSCGPPERGCFV